MKKHEFEQQFCLLPWIALDVGISGNYRPCCKYENFYGSREHNPNIRAQTVDFEQGWLSEAAGDIRYDFVSGKKPDECVRCWDEEKAGIKSMRQAEFENFSIRDLRTPEQLAAIKSPLILDLKLGNACNLKCRVCDPYHSTLWWNEYQADPSMPREAWLQKHDNFMTEKNWETLKKWLPDLQRLMIFGGEPLFQKDFFRVLDIADEVDAARNLTFVINTNSTIFDKRLSDRYGKFQAVEISHSIDDIGKRFEYQRHPGKWDKTLDVLHTYENTRKENVVLTLYCTVSMFNVYYLPEYLEWAGNTFPNHRIILNLVHFPARFSISNLPAKAKSEITHRLKYIDPKKYNFLYDGQIRSVVEYMNKAQVEADFRNGITEIKRADKFREENFQETFPELFELLKEHF